MIREPLFKIQRRAKTGDATAVEALADRYVEEISGKKGYSPSTAPRLRMYWMMGYNREAQPRLRGNWLAYLHNAWLAGKTARNDVDAILAPVTV